jgi:hypothetical protein
MFTDKQIAFALKQAEVGPSVGNFLPPANVPWRRLH